MSTYSRINAPGQTVIVGQSCSLPGITGMVSAITKLSDGAARVTVHTDAGDDVLVDVAGITTAVVETP